MPDNKLYKPIFRIHPTQLIASDQLLAFDWRLVKTLSPQELSRFFILGSKFLLCFNISELNAFDKQEMDLILSIFFSRNYLVRKQKAAIIILVDGDVEQLEGFKELESMVKAQGFAGLELMQKLPVLTREKQINELYASLLASDLYCIIEGESGADIAESKANFDAILTSGLSKTGLLFFAEKYYDNLIYREQDEELNLQLRDKLTAANSFVEVAKFKYKDDYEELFRFYHAEYEVLPKWYKRFGHLLKVMTGKRTIRSIVKK